MVFQNAFLVAATMVAGWPCFALDYRLMGACPDAVTAEGAGFTNALACTVMSRKGEQPTGEPLDWMATQSPAKWRFGSDTVEYSWD